MNNRHKYSRRSLVIMLLTVMLGFAAIASVGLIVNRKQNIEKSSAQSAPVQIKTVEIVYRPGGTTVPESQMNIIKETVRGMISEASKPRGYKNPFLLPTAEIQIIHPGFKRDVWNVDGNWEDIIEREFSSSSGNVLSDGKTVCDVVNEYDADQVWIWVDSSLSDDSFTGGEEYFIYSPNSNYGRWNSSWVTAGRQLCGRKSLVIMGFDYSRPASLALHSYGHMAEAFLYNMLGQDIYERYTGTKYRENIGRDSKASSLYPISDTCGDVHTPPNITVGATGYYPGYEYNDSRSVTSACEDWHPAENISLKTIVNSETWNSLGVPGDSEAKYLIWWFQNIPNVNAHELVYRNPADGVEYVLPNFWGFLANTDDAIRYYMTESYLGKEFWLSPNLEIPVSEASLSSKIFSREGTVTTWNAL